MKALALAMLFVLAVGGLSVSTQYVAAHLGADGSLGAPWCVLGHTAVYPPWAWLGWSATYADRAPAIFRTASAITTGSAVAAVLLVALLSLRRRPTATSNAHGSSRWATSEEIARGGLLRGAGVVLCQTDDASFKTRVDSAGKTETSASSLGRLVRHDGPEHVFCFAPTRSGKGVGLVIPTLLSWPHSTIVYDIKKENWALTAGWPCSSRMSGGSSRPPSIR